MPLSFDDLAEHFDTHRGLPIAALRQLVAYIDELMSDQPVRVIEPGIGTGRIALPIAADGHQVTGIDISGPMLTACQRKADKLGLADRLTLVKADALDMPFAEDSFDVGVVAQLLYLIPDWAGVLDELDRIVRPGGVIIHLLERTQESDDLARWDLGWRMRVESTGYKHPPISPTTQEVSAEMQRRWPDTTIEALAAWTFGQTVGEAWHGFGSRLRPLYASVPEDDWNRTIREFQNWAEVTFPDPDMRLDGTVVLEAVVSRV